LITVRAERRFTRVVDEIDIAGGCRTRGSKQIARCGFEPRLVAIRVTCIGGASKNSRGVAA
jgi:hypothetical protein